MDFMTLGITEKEEKNIPKVIKYLDKKSKDYPTLLEDNFFHYLLGNGKYIRVDYKEKKIRTLGLDSTTFEEIKSVLRGKK